MLIIFSLSLLSCAEEKAEPKDLANYIPENAALILKLQNPNLFFSHLQNNELLRSNEDFPLTANLEKQLSFLNLFDHKTPAYLSLSTVKGRSSYTFVQHGIPDSLQLDSISNKSVETFTADFGQIKKYTLEDQVTYTGSIDSIYLVSDSRSSLEALLQNGGNNKLPYPADLEKALKASANDKPVILINHQEFSKLATQLLPLLEEDAFSGFSNWTSLDTEITPSAIKLNGITTASDTLPKLINAFKGVAPSANELAGISPVSSLGFYSFTFENFSTLHSNLQKINGKTPAPVASEEVDLLQNASEAGLIYFEKSPVFAVKSLDPETSKSVFSSSGELLEEFHGIAIYSYQGEEKFDFLNPLVSAEGFNYFLFLDRFILFSSDLDQLKEVVTSVQNEKVLAVTEAYKNSFQSLSTEASLLWVSNNRNFKNKLSTYAAEDFREEITGLDFTGFPIAALQFIYQSDFAHVHAVLQKAEGEIETAGLSQEVSITLENRLLAPPVFFDNHRSDGLDIAVQDVNNTLYLISPAGKIYWKKKLDGPILGKIQQVDLYRNGRKQLAFATPHSVEVIDRDGNSVKPFPLEFRDEITQPLAVFDYDNNRKYRFLVVQKEDVYMYDSKGNGVSGFRFKEAGGEINLPPKHIRIGRKDYILISEASGKLNILSRTGQSRVNIKGTLNPSGNEWYEHEGAFVTTSKDGELVKISENGNLNRQALGLSDNHGIAATERTLVTLSDNQLSIKGKTISLDFGLYTEPQIFYLNNKIYVSVTDIQAHKVYLFDSNAELLPDFPVYGNSGIDLGNADGDASLELTVMGDEDSVLVYEL